MTDSQWPRYEVFQQENKKRPHRSVGTVHAPDDEMALLNARDVFGRRPDNISMWVIRSDQIFSRTGEELAVEQPWHSHMSPDEMPNQPYFVFRKTSQRRAMTFVEHVGEVEAVSPEHALRQAIEAFGDDKEVFVWWVCPARAVTRTQPDEVDSLFAPALDKPYKHPSYYHTFTAMREVKQKIDD